jgi:hypothetical protein
MKKRSNSLIYSQKTATLRENKNLSKQRKKEIRKYFRNFGLEVNTDLHETIYALNGIDSNYYLSEYVFFAFIEPYLNDERMITAYSDKNLYSRIFQEVSQPKTIMRYIRGAFFEESYKRVDHEDAVDVILKLNEPVIIKPSVASGGGKNVNILRGDKNSIFLNDKPISFEALTHLYDSGFIIQKRVKQHQVLDELYPHSLNTIRLMSFRYKSETKIISVLFRTGNKGSYIDNVAQSGFATGVKPDGRLMDVAYDRNLRTIREHPDTNVPFGSVVIPNFDKLLQSVRKMHEANFYCNIASWDCAIDKDGNPVLIEVNLRHQDVFFRQMIYGPLFGDQTDEILRDVFSKSS